MISLVFIARIYGSSQTLVECLIPGKMQSMTAPRKYPEELRECAIRLAIDQTEEGNGIEVFRRVGEQLGIDPETLCGWVRRAQIDEGRRPGTTPIDAQRVREPDSEVDELCRANAVLRSASGLFAAELDRPQR